MVITPKVLLVEGSQATAAAPVAMIESGRVNEVEDGSGVSMLCELTYGGDAPNWRVDWVRNEDKLSSLTDDINSKVRRRLNFDARLKESSGVYRCTVSSRAPHYTSSCTTNITVLRST